MNWQELLTERKEWTPELAMEKAASYGDYYQAFDLGGGVSIGTENRGFGTLKWKRLVAKHVPDNLRNQRILDVGCNAGYYAIECCRRNAREVVGVELNPQFYDMALFAKSYIESYEQKNYPIRYINGNALDVIDKDLGYFDFAFVGNMLYYLEEKAVDLVQRLSQVTGKLIVTCNINTEYGTVEALKGILLKGGFRVIAVDTVEEEPTSPLLVAEIIPDFKFGIIEVRMDGLLYDREEIKNTPQVEFLQAYLNDNHLDIQSTRLFHHIVNIFTEIAYRRGESAIQETLESLFVRSRQYCENLITIFNGIAEDGYLGGEHSTDYIPVVRRDRQYDMLEGIHRAACLYVLGYGAVKVCALLDSERPKWQPLIIAEQLGNYLKEKGLQKVSSLDKWQGVGEHINFTVTLLDGGGIGDCAHHYKSLQYFRVLRHLKQIFPNLKVILQLVETTSAPAHQLFEKDPYIDQVVSCRPTEYRIGKVIDCMKEFNIAQSEYESICPVGTDPHDGIYRSANQIFAMMQFPGVQGIPIDWFFQQMQINIHDLEYDLAEVFLSKEEDNFGEEIASRFPKGMIGFHWFSNSKTRAQIISSETWLRISEVLLDRGYGLVVIGGPGEDESHCGAWLSLKDRENTVGLFNESLRQKVAVMKRCDYMITVDSAMMHLSWLHAIPTLTIVELPIPASDPDYFENPDGFHWAAAVGEPFAHRIIFKEGQADRITPKQVTEALEKLSGTKGQRKYRLWRDQVGHNS